MMKLLIILFAVTLIFFGCNPVKTKRQAQNGVMDLTGLFAPVAFIVYTFFLEEDLIFPDRLFGEGSF